MSNTNKVHALCDFFASVFFYGALTHLRGGGIYSDSFLTNCLIILPVKNYKNRSTFYRPTKTARVSLASPLLTLLTHISQHMTYITVVTFRFNFKLCFYA